MSTSRQNSSDQLIEDGLVESWLDATDRYRTARQKLKGSIFFDFDHNQKHQEKEPLIKIAKQIVKDADEVYDEDIWHQSHNNKTMIDLADSLDCIVRAIEHPEDHSNFHRIATLAGDVKTQASLGKKVVAGLILTAAILTILAFGALVLATQGVALAALPVIGPVITLGLSWLAAAATTLGVSSTFLAAFGLGTGAFGMALGVGIAVDGQAKGLAKSMHNFHHALNRERTSAGISDTLTTDNSLVF